MTDYSTALGAQPPPLRASRMRSATSCNDAATPSASRAGADACASVADGRIGAALGARAGHRALLRHGGHARCGPARRQTHEEVCDADESTVGGTASGRAVESWGRRAARYARCRRRSMRRMSWHREGGRPAMHGMRRHRQGVAGDRRRLDGTPYTHRAAPMRCGSAVGDERGASMPRSQHRCADRVRLLQRPRRRSRRNAFSSPPACSMWRFSSDAAARASPLRHSATTSACSDSATSRAASDSDS